MMKPFTDEQQINRARISRHPRVHELSRILDLTQDHDAKGVKAHRASPSKNSVGWFFTSAIQIIFHVNLKRHRQKGVV